MVEVGQYTTLKALKILPIGAILDDDDEGILLPIRYTPKELNVGDELEVFIYRDSEDRLIATTLKPRLIAGEFGLLRVSAVNRFGAFMDWGLPKDLLVPFKEQKISMEEERSYVVYVYVDPITDRLAASSKLDKYVSNEELSVAEGDEVNLLVVSKTDLGYNVIINGLHWGLIYMNEVFQRVDVGKRMKGFIKTIREDQKIDVSLQAIGMPGLDDAAVRIMEKLKSADGHLPISDKSSPEEIYELMSMSKKTYKRAIGTLYKQRLILIESDGIKLIEASE